jgi:hypothetical protein
MKKVKITYWIFTGLMTALMGVGAAFDAVSAPEAIEYITGHLGYPAYLVPFLGVAKLAGLVAILVPGFARLKEWAYAGLVIDLVGALYSHISVGDGPEVWVGLIVLLLLVGSSYMFYHKLQRAAGSESVWTSADRLGPVNLSGS